jgi:hypothetical protein
MCRAIDSFRGLTQPLVSDDMSRTDTESGDTSRRDIRVRGNYVIAAPYRVKHRTTSPQEITGSSPIGAKITVAFADIVAFFAVLHASVA